jgi:hypothetical protein
MKRSSMQLCMNEWTPLRKAFLETLILTRKVKKFPSFLELGDSLSGLRRQLLYPDMTRSNPVHIITPYLSKVYPIINLPSTRRLQSGSWLPDCCMYVSRRNLSSENSVNFTFFDLIRPVTGGSPSQWPRSLRHELSSLSRTLGSWFRIPLNAWMSVCVYSVFVLFCV